MRSNTINAFQAKTNGRAVSEGREISPTRQHKIDELWNSSSSTLSKDSAIGKRSNMMTKSSVSRSMDLDDSHMDSPSAKGWLKHAVPNFTSSEFFKSKIVTINLYVCFGVLERNVSFVSLIYVQFI